MSGGDEAQCAPSADAAEPLKKFRLSPAIIPLAVRVVESVLIAATILLGFALVERHTDFVSVTMYDKNVFIVFMMVSYNIIGMQAGIFATQTVMMPLYRIEDTAITVMSGMLFFFSMAMGFGVAERFPLPTMLSAVGACILALALWRILLFHCLRALAAWGLTGRRAVVLGTGDIAQRFLARVAAVQPYFVHIEGMYRLDEERPDAAASDMRVLGGLDHLMGAIRAGWIDDVVVAAPLDEGGCVTRTIERLREMPVNVSIAADPLGAELVFQPMIGSSGALALLQTQKRPISGWSSLLKTIEDYVLATLMLILISPLLIAIAVAIKLDTPGPILFRQKRLGFNNQEFWIYKFRSMHHNHAQADGSVRQATRGDPRVTRVGRVIRATSLDELPQLFNVLDGTMSLVGPRPHAVSHNALYGSRIRGYFARHNVKPGITGWAQVNGLRGETETIEKMQARIEYDVFYAQNWSLLFDLRILVTTAFVVFTQKSAY